MYESYSAPFDETKLARIAEYILKHPGKGHGRALNADKASSKPVKFAADELAELPMAVPELPTTVVPRNKVTSVLRGHVLADGTNMRVLAHGQGGVGESLTTTHLNVIIVHSLNTPNLQERPCCQQRFGAYVFIPCIISGCQNGRC